jgi:SAM-dependent MidA family methyltransferase
MSVLTDIIKDEMRKQGPITFARFMELALYHPEYGYYTSGNAVIGKEGDFYTSPHVSNMFGRLISESYLKLKDKIGEDTCHFVEMGAGHGYIAKDFLTHLSEYHKDEYSRCHYVIVERSGAMRDKQRKTLGPLAGNVAWYKSLDEMSGKLTGVFFSNELVDALPFHRIKQSADRLNELYVTFGQRGFMETLGKVSSPEIPMHLNRLGFRLKDDTCTEVNLEADKWLASVAAKMDKGFVITVDYGYPAWEYYSAERNNGTIMTFKDHRASEDPFQDVGERDITAHVDFTSLCMEGKEHGLMPALYTSQSSFLADAAEGLTVVMKDVGKGLITLMHPDIMGSVFKVLVLAKYVDTAGMFGDVRNRLDELSPPDSCWAPA